MEITNIRYAFNEGYPELLLQIDGKEANIPLEQKPTTYENGLIFLGADFEETMPEIELEGTTLRGFTNDTGVLRVYKEFLDAANRVDFTPGVIA
jgi:hypothetical protein